MPTRRTDDQPPANHPPTTRQPPERSDSHVVMATSESDLSGGWGPGPGRARLGCRQSQSAAVQDDGCSGMRPGGAPVGPESRHPAVPVDRQPTVGRQAVLGEDHPPTHPGVAGPANPAQPGDDATVGALAVPHRATTKPGITGAGDVVPSARRVAGRVQGHRRPRPRSGLYVAPDQAKGVDLGNVVAASRVEPREAVWVAEEAPDERRPTVERVVQPHQVDHVLHDDRSSRRAELAGDMPASGGGRQGVDVAVEDQDRYVSGAERHARRDDGQRPSRRPGPRQAPGVCLGVRKHPDPLPGRERRESPGRKSGDGTVQLATPIGWRCPHRVQLRVVGAGDRHEEAVRVVRRRGTVVAVVVADVLGVQPQQQTRVAVARDTRGRPHRGHGRAGSRSRRR